jgi:hypothetical protein
MSVGRTVQGRLVGQRDSGLSAIHLAVGDDCGSRPVNDAGSNSAAAKLAPPMTNQ